MDLPGVAAPIPCVVKLRWIVGEAFRHAIGATDNLVAPKSRMDTCRECQLFIDPGTKVCPHCGTDLTLPPPEPVPESAEPSGMRAVLREWGIAIIVIAVAAGALGGFLWYELSGPRVAPAERAEGVAAESLRQVREALSVFAMSTGGAYPATLEPLGEQARAPVQTALGEGYALVYTPAATESDGKVRSYVLLASPGKSGGRNLYLDESGILRATPESRPANAQDPPL